MVIGDDKDYTALSLDNTILLPLHYHYLEPKWHSSWAPSLSRCWQSFWTSNRLFALLLILLRGTTSVHHKQAITVVPSPCPMAPSPYLWILVSLLILTGNLEHLRFSLSNCPDWVGLWECPLETVSIVNWCARAQQPAVSSTIPWAGSSLGVCKTPS